MKPSDHKPTTPDGEPTRTDGRCTCALDCPNARAKAGKAAWCNCWCHMGEYVKMKKENKEDGK